jgi:putative sterol carrier protein
MGIRDVTELVRRKVGMDSGLGSVLKLDLGSDGVIVIDATVVPNVVDNEDRDAQCTLSTTCADLDAIMRGTLEAMAAFGEGRLRLHGDMGLAMKLGEFIRGG